jgi:trans-aconitate methyltransferase
MLSNLTRDLNVEIRQDKSIGPSSTSCVWNPRLYDSRHAFVPERGDELISLLKPARGESVLDLGCGTGRLTSRIAEAGSRVVGLDNSPEMLEEARKNYPALTFVLADACNFVLDEPFDAVFSNAALHWVKEAGLVVGCVWRALKPGGRFVAEFGGKGNIRTLVEGFYRALEKIGVRPGEISNPWYFPSVAEYTTLLERRGFDVTFASLFERITALDDGDRGLRNWIRMFGAAFYAGLPDEQQEEFMRESENSLRSLLFRDGSWFIDYRRLRVVAHRR